MASGQPSRFPSSSRDRVDGTVFIGVWDGCEAGLESSEGRYVTYTCRKCDRGSSVAQLVAQSPCLLCVLAWVYGV